MLINELAKATGISKDSIRHYQELGLLDVEKQAAGSRSYNQYPAVNVDRIEIIKMGKSMGFTLKEIATHIDAYFSGQLSVNEQVEIYRDKLSSVDAKIKELEQARSFIRNKIELLTSETGSTC